MTVRDALESLLATRGVRGLAVATVDGAVVEAVGRRAGDVEAVAGLVTGGLASASALAALFGDGEVRQATLAYDHGPVLLQPIGDAPVGHVVVALLDDMEALGRVRAAVRRRLGELAQAAA